MFFNHANVLTKTLFQQVTLLVSFFLVQNVLVSNLSTCRFVANFCFARTTSYNTFPSN